METDIANATTHESTDNLFGLPDSLLVPTLFDLMVHAAPDCVLGDGGSLYLKIPLPRSESEHNSEGPCFNCPFGQADIVKNRPCGHRAYLVATTRDHARVQSGREFYCTNKTRYAQAGQELVTALNGDKSIYEKLYNLIIGVNDGLPHPSMRISDGLFSKASKDLFKLLFVPPLSSVQSQCTELLDRLYRDRNNSTKASRFDSEAMRFINEIEDSHADAKDSMTGLFHQTAILRFSQLQEEKNAAIRGIVWELYRYHDLLTDRRDKINNTIKDEIRPRFRHLGLSGWAAAFGRPVVLRNIENPFESRDYPDWCNGWAVSKGMPRINMPVPIWGDLARGHQDRLEREGRPFLVVPVMDPSRDNSTETLGFLRVATKREGERQFTMDDLNNLHEYAQKIALYLTKHKFPVHIEQNQDLNNIDRSCTSKFWWNLHLYGAVKGQSISQLGNLAACAFRETFNATAASVYLREDLWPPTDLKPARATEQTNSSQNNIKSKPEERGRRYVLWGTDIDSCYIAKDIDRRKKYEDFQSCRGSLGPGSYREAIGKTGWTLKNKAALLVYYGSPESDKKTINRVIIKLSATQEIQAEQKDGTWDCSFLRGTIAQDPTDLDRLVQTLLERGGSGPDRCEIEEQSHSLFVAATLIDPDISPEPLGLVRMIFENVPDSCRNSEDISALLSKLILVPMAQFARGFCRLLRQHVTRGRLLHTVTDLVTHTHLSPQSIIDREGANAINQTASHEFMTAGPYANAAASLLAISEASSVTIFIQNRYAPTSFREESKGKQSWVAVGSAAAYDALTDEDRIHFSEKYCSKYYRSSDERCRYYEDTGRTGKTIKEGKIRDWDPSAENDTQRSGMTCEVSSPSAFLVVPTPLITPDNSKAEVIAAVRFVRTQERRRAKFLPEEMERLSTIVDLLRQLVPSWSQQNAYDEFQAKWKETIGTVFPPALCAAVRTILGEISEYKSANTSMQRPEETLRQLEASIPIWAFSPAQPRPSVRSGLDIERDEIAVLGWFMHALQYPQSEISVPQLVGKALRALLRIHWEEREANCWIDKLDRLERFEPILAELPRYRDHSIHQFQVFLIGWILLRFFKKRELIELEYKGWESPSEKQGSQNLTKTKDLSEKVVVNARVWLLSALFHDVAYPLEHAYSWANLFGRTLTGADGSYEFVANGKAEMLFANIKTPEKGTFERLPHFAGSYEYLAAEVRSILAEMAPPETAITAALSDLMKNWDHGMWAAVVLLHTVTSDITSEIMQAAVAIALHNKLVRKLAEWHIKVPINRDQTVMPFLLLLCDSLHEWGRDLWNPTEKAPEFNDLNRRPSLKNIAQSGEDASTFHIDLAMGGSCSVYFLQQKAAEFRALREILAGRDDSPVANIIIRVFKESIDNMAKTASDDLTIKFCL
jgi:hypothetical protein